MGDRTDEPLPRALVVDDEKQVADAYALRLRGLCAVDTVYGGEAALDAVAGEDFDVVLLDRHMPGMSGDDVLAALSDRGFEGRVIMVTAIDPGFDVLDMPFDDYLCKPVEREDVRAAVEQQCTTLGYETLGEYFSLEAKCRVIEAELPADRREDHEGYREATARADRLKQRAARLLDDADSLFERFDTVGRESR
ncbi:response regulator [Halostella salina]|uniref:response regulator n=1 Tax=Halostella salina TaxID=1547897 RepID=UPI000EF7FCBE|nr:response regulator [Halostella salina]